MDHPTFRDAAELLEWRPRHGVVSVYLRLDPGDRSGAWRTELRNGLAALQERDLGHDATQALRTTVRRILERFDEGDRRQMARGQVGFVEVSEKRGAERWWSTQTEPPQTSITYDETPLIGPFICMAQESVHRGVALVSAERVRLLEWAPGRLDELENWEITLFSRDWRERKSRSTSDPARAQGVSAAGRDQYDQRLNENRERFREECGRLSAGIASDRSWRHLVVFGSGPEVGSFRAGFNSSPPCVEAGGESDLISAPTADVDAAVTAAVRALEGRRQERLVRRLLEEAGGGARAASGPGETSTALTQGQVEHLVLSADRQGDEIESLIRGALASGARVTILSEEAGRMLEPVEGVAATLRYSLP